MTRNRDIADFLGKTEAINTDNSTLRTTVEIDSALITSLIDSSYIQIREDNSGAAAGTDSAATIDIIEDELSTFSVGDLVGADGNPGDMLVSDGDGTASWTGYGANSVEFKVTYKDSGGTSVIDSVQSLPTGWTVDTKNQQSLVVSHNIGRSVKDVTFNRYVGGTLKLKRSDSADLVTYLVADRLNKFTLRAGTLTTGADSAQYSWVNMIF